MKGSYDAATLYGVPVAPCPVSIRRMYGPYSTINTYILTYICTP